MSRKISLVEKRQWLQEYDAGQSEHSLHKKHRKDIRTVKSGLESARVDRDLSTARVAVMRDVLLKHQGRLLERLHDYQVSIRMPKEDAEELYWVQRNKSVFSKTSSEPPTDEPYDPVAGMLKQHLKGDKVWKLIEDWQEAYRTNATARESLQRKIFSIMKRIGYPVFNPADKRKPCLYADNVGTLFYSSALIAAFSPEKSFNPEQNIITHTEYNTVTCLRDILIEEPSNLEEARVAVVKAYRRVKRLDEVQKVLETQNALKQITNKAQRAIEEILLIDYIPGDCSVCRRMSQP